VKKLKLWMLPYKEGRSLSIVLLFALVALLACQSPPPVVTTPASTLKGDRLAFETIEQRDQARGDDYEQPQPALAIIARPDDLGREPMYVSPETVDILAGLDFDRRLALIVYQGSKPSTGFGVTIQEIVVRDSQVMIMTDFETPAPDHEVGALETSPYHVVSVERANLRGVMTFVLIDVQTQEILLEKEVTFDE